MNTMGQLPDVSDGNEAMAGPRSRVFVGCAIGACLVTLLLPFFIAIVTHFVVDPSWLALALDMVLVGGVWLVAAILSLAWVVAGGSRSKAGAAVLLGEALGILTFMTLVWWAFTHPMVSS
jgi:hypothetical protein